MMSGTAYLPDECAHPDAVVAYRLRNGQWEWLGVVHCADCGERNEFRREVGEQVKVVRARDQVGK